MRYSYTWNHIKILASICECNDNRITITPNWINILDDHHKTTFPFTLWPLTYRTSTVMVSSALSTPKVSNLNHPKNCNMTMKQYKSNEVMVVCFQHEDNDKSCEKCLNDPSEPNCIFSLVNTEKNETDENKNLLRIFSKIKNKAMRNINKLLFETSSNDDYTISFIILTGYGIGAAMASFMSREIALSQKKEQIHLGLDKPKIVVDCVTFESPSNLAGEKYWKQIEDIVDKYVDVQHHDKKRLRSINECRELSCLKSEHNKDDKDDEDDEKSSVRIGSIILIDSLEKYKHDDDIFDDVSIRSYVKEIDKKIYMLPYEK